MPVYPQNSLHLQNIPLGHGMKFDYAIRFPFILHMFIVFAYLVSEPKIHTDRPQGKLLSRWKFLWLLLPSSFYLLLLSGGQSNPLWGMSVFCSSGNSFWRGIMKGTFHSGLGVNIYEQAYHEGWENAFWGPVHSNSLFSGLGRKSSSNSRHFAYQVPGCSCPCHQGGLCFLQSSSSTKDGIEVIELRSVLASQQDSHWSSRYPGRGP